MIESVPADLGSFILSRINGFQTARTFFLLPQQNCSSLHLSLHAVDCRVGQQSRPVDFRVGRESRRIKQATSHCRAGQTKQTAVDWRVGQQSRLQLTALLTVGGVNKTDYCRGQP
jgi:hypothetical protein